MADKLLLINDSSERCGMGRMKNWIGILNLSAASLSVISKNDPYIATL